MSIHYVRNRQGAITSVRAVAAKVSGTQIRATFSVRKYGTVNAAERAAKKWATEKAKAIEGDRHAIIAVPNALLREVIECLELLEPHRKRIIDVVREYVKRPERFTDPWTFREAADAFLASRRAGGRRKEYLRALEDTFNLAARTFSERMLSAITTEEIERWLGSRGQGKPIAPVTFGNYRRMLSMLYAFAIARHRCELNPVEPIPLPAKKDEPVKILSAAQVKALLWSAKRPVRTYIAVLAFAGVRPFEILAVHDNSIDSSYLHLRLEGWHTKSRSRRLVTIPDNLREWLRTGGADLGEIHNYWHLRRSMLVAAKAAGVTLTQDVLRHSFASHHLALHRNAALTADQMGHRSQQVLFEHYRELVTQEEAVAYFSILPP